MNIAQTIYQHVKTTTNKGKKNERSRISNDRP